MLTFIIFVGTTRLPLLELNGGEGRRLLSVQVKWKEGPRGKVNACGIEIL